ncbi:hypothetical protein BD289DRAFT_373489 [Coniella lustricola]|uniref:Tim17/Tim22/Tim23/Pmp24 family-domain-containing protein n=1 Tax=Coniella lustricola TaxID=2025994 RepID=A0A2T3A0X6_9PEZI|nr:hypothetical protein BD289DRAFT_373489 [Coniella lustricola]
MSGSPSTTLEEARAAQHRLRPTPETVAQRAERQRLDRENSRLHMLPPLRILLASFSSFCVGAALGLSHGGKMAGLRFRAEHAHKLPATSTGWFMYHKSKNYTMMREGIKEGLRMGCRVSFWTTAMFAIETLYDSYRQSNDFVNTVLASVTVAGGFSLWNRFSLATTARATKSALVVGLVYGGLQDVMGAARGRPIGYMDWVRRHLGSSTEHKQTAAR